MLGIAADEDDDAGSAQAGHGERDTDPPPPDPNPDPPKATFAETIATLQVFGVAALIGNVDSPEDEMRSRMNRVLGSMGFEKCSEITDRKQQLEFYGAIKDMIDEIRKQFPSPVS
jgi:hypothetical protein